MFISLRPKSTPKRIVVARNDRIGDFILALPCFKLLRRHFPDSELVAYVPEYTREIATMCPDIDRTVADPKLDKKPTIERVSADWRNEQFDLLVALRPTWDVAWPGRNARIPVRVGPLTNRYSLLFTHPLRQHRSKSIKPEWDYNLDLARYALSLYGIDGADAVQRPVVNLDTDRVLQRRQELVDRFSLDPQRPIVFVHPGQSGTSANLSVAQYETLIRSLESPDGHNIVISAGPGELGLAQELSQCLPDVPHAIYESTEGIRAYAETIATADLFVASSTGPLHVAGMIDRPTAGFYETRVTRGKLRWQTLNSRERRLGYDLPPADDHEAMVAAAKEMSRRYLRHPEQFQGQASA
jgi:ADP-heptose:LPS heptosyltransferase